MFDTGLQRKYHLFYRRMPEYHLTQNSLHSGFAAHPDVRETWSTHTNGTRLPAVKSADGDYVANPSDNVDGILINGTLPTSEAQGVHSLSDVPVYTKGTSCAALAIRWGY